MSSFERNSVFADDLRGSDDRRSADDTPRVRDDATSMDDLFGAPSPRQREKPGRMRIKTW